MQKKQRPNSSFHPLPWQLFAFTTILLLLFSASLLTLYLTMPHLNRSLFTAPHTLDELQFMRNDISSYTKDYMAQVLLCYITAYIFMQTFMIPGTIFLSLLAGALFGVYKGLVLVIFSATAGASSCYFLSKLFGRPVVFWLWPEKLRLFQAELSTRQEKLLNYMLFLRITPALPNTFINLASPIVGIPYHIFFLATCFGIIPASFITVRAGCTLGQLESLQDLYDLKTVILLFLIGFLFIIPTIISRPKKASA